MMTTSQTATALSHLRVLVVDDTRLTQHVINQQLHVGGYRQIKFAESPKEVREAIDQFHPHVIILDWMMPQVNGLSMTKMIRAHDRTTKFHTYVLMVTGKDGQDAMMQAFQEGVDDFIAKADVATQLLPRMLRADRFLNQWLQQNRQMTVLQERVQQQQQLITVDPISRLPTQQGFTLFFGKAIDTATSRNKGLSCLLLNITNIEQLKHVNTQQANQKLIQLFVDRLQRQLRVGDYVARTGTAEFTMLFQHEKNMEIPTLDRLEKSLNKLSLKTKDGFQTIEVKTAAATLLTDTFTEEWNVVNLQDFLREVILNELPLLNRIRHSWPTAKQTTQQTYDDYLFT